MEITTKLNEGQLQVILNDIDDASAMRALNALQKEFSKSETAATTSVAPAPTLAAVTPVTPVAAPAPAAPSDLVASPLASSVPVDNTVPKARKKKPVEGVDYDWPADVRQFVLKNLGQLLAVNEYRNARQCGRILRALMIRAGKRVVEAPEQTFTKSFAMSMIDLVHAKQVDKRADFDDETKNPTSWYRLTNKGVSELNVKLPTAQAGGLRVAVARPSGATNPNKKVG